MSSIIIQLCKYAIIVCMTFYTLFCFSVFAVSGPEAKKTTLRTQTVLMFLIHALAYIAMFMATLEKKLLTFYLMQVILLGAAILLYTFIYPRVSRLVVNNMCMLLCCGFIMLTRLNTDIAIRQFVLAGCAIAVSLIVPVIIRKFKLLSEWQLIYSVAGIAALTLVLILGRISGGAYLSFTVAGISIQPSEIVKIIFVFYVASSFKKSLDFRDICITTVVAAAHVLILVISKDLGAALIIFVVYLVMLYVASRQFLYVFAGLGAGSLASVVAYYLFSHVRTRVVAWKDPIAAYDNGGYQIAQSLFAIGTGGWFGMGLYQGSPDTIPVATSDCIFAAISEEMGLIFALCIVLICLSCYVMFLNIAMQLHSIFYKLVALGLGTCYIFQVFLTIGGETKFIPLTGVTLPLVSYGGSSLFSTIIMFAIIQGLYILREDEEDEIERKRKEAIYNQSPEELRSPASRKANAKKAGKRSNEQKRTSISQPGRKTGEKEKPGKKQRIR